MSKVHITLVGGQPAPVFNGISAINPDKVVFVYSKDSADVLAKIMAEITVEHEEKELNPIDVLGTENLALQLAETYAGDEVSVNISSGTKVWSYYFASVFEKCDNASIVFMDQNNALWNLKDKTSSRDFVFDMHVLFRLYGNSLENNYTPFADYSDRDFEVIIALETLRKSNYKEFANLLSTPDKKRANEIKNKEKGELYLDSGSYAKWEKSEDKKDDIINILLYNKKTSAQNKLKLQSENGKSLAFFTGWFELKVARLLSTWENAEEICLNCKFPFRDEIDKNEVDIIVNTGTKILFVECKTQIYNNTDIDKFRTVVKTYGGMGSKALFVTDEIMTEVAKQKCEDHGILTFSLKENHLNLSADKALHWLLNNELLNINTK